MERPASRVAEAVEFTTLEWVDRFNDRRLSEPKLAVMRGSRRMSPRRDPNKMASGKSGALQSDGGFSAA